MLCPKLAVYLLAFSALEAWSPAHQSSVAVSRRTWINEISAASAALAWSSQNPAARAASAIDTALGELEDSKVKLSEVPDLLQQQEWDKVRTILKTPPVNKLWNLGDSQNIVLQLAKETGNVELFEMKDDLALDLQMTDQLTYDNVFVYFQPGSGKVKIKEPQQMANKAISKLQQIIDESK